jgi:hypothetical protein
MNYSFHPEAEIEFNEAVDYYETCQAGLGLAFAKEIFSTVQRILGLDHRFGHLPFFSFGRGRDENPLPPFSRGKLVWTMGEKIDCWPKR